MRLATAILLVLASFATRADDPPTPVDPRLAELEAQVALLTAKATIAEKQGLLLNARFGTPATAPAGSVDGQEHFAAFGQWALSSIYDDLGGKAAEIVAPHKAKCSAGYLITSTADRSQTLLAAKLIHSKLGAYTADLDKLLPAAIPAGAPLAAAPAVIAAVAGLFGSADKLVGLFRSDYKLTSVTAEPNTLAARVVVASALADKLGASTDIIVEGLDQRSDERDLVVSYRAFSDSLRRADRRYAMALAAAQSDDEKAKLAYHKSVLDSAHTFDGALTTLDAGVVPLMALSAALESTRRCVCFVDFAGLGSVLITRKRLLSRNDNLVAISGGTALLVLFDGSGNTLARNRLRVDKRLTGRLSKFVDTATEVGKP